MDTCGFHGVLEVADEVTSSYVASSRKRSIRICLAFATMLLVKHGDSRPEAKKGLNDYEDMDD